MRHFFARLDEKRKLLGYFEKIFENFKNFIKKIAKNAYISKTLTNHVLLFRAFGRQMQIVGKF